MSYDGPEKRDHTSREALVDAIACAVRNEISCLTVPEEQHREHHDFIKTWIERQKRKDERWDKIKAQVGGWMIVALLGGVGKGAWEVAVYVKEHLK